MSDVTINLKVAPAAGSTRTPTTWAAYCATPQGFLINDAAKTSVAYSSPRDGGTPFKTGPLSSSGYGYTGTAVLPSTTDSPDRPNTAAWAIYVLDANGRWMYPVAELEAFRLDHTATTALDAEDIAAFNSTPQTLTSRSAHVTGRLTVDGGLDADVSACTGFPTDPMGPSFESVESDKGGWVRYQADNSGEGEFRLLKGSGGSTETILRADEAGELHAETPLNLRGDKGEALGEGDIGDSIPSINDVRLRPLWTRLGTLLWAETNADAGNLYEPSIVLDTNPVLLTDLSLVIKGTITVGWGTLHTYYFEASLDFKRIKRGPTPAVSNRARGFLYLPAQGGTLYLSVANAASTQVDIYKSTDHGATFTLDTAAVIVAGGGWEAGAISNTEFRFEGSKWKFLYEAGNGSGSAAVGYAEGATFGSVVKNSAPVAQIVGGMVGGPSRVRKIGSTYYCYMHASNGPGELPTDIYLWSSTNPAVSWSRVSLTPVIPRETEDEGAGTSVGQTADPDWVEIDGKTFLIYSASRDGSQASGNLHIKLAVANADFDTLTALAQTTDPASIGAQGRAADGGPSYVPVTFQNGWVNYGSGLMTAAYYNDGRRMWVKGCIKSGTLDGSHEAFTLPLGPNESIIERAITSAGAAAQVNVTPDGKVTPITGSNAFFAFRFSFFIGE